MMLVQSSSAEARCIIRSARDPVGDERLSLAMRFTVEPDRPALAGLGLAKGAPIALLIENGIYSLPCDSGA